MAMDPIKLDTTNSSCPATDASIQVDCRGKTCPVPLVEVRKALMRAKPGQIIEVVGTHTPSKKEIPMAVEAVGSQLLSVEGSDTDWKIRIRR
jgi:tRNA 2-thiouridine synthesizing protein A